MPNTPRGLPYPNPTDPVASGAANIQALAQAVDPLLPQELAYGENQSAATVSPGTPVDMVGTAAIPISGPVMVEFYVPGIILPGGVNWGTNMYLVVDGTPRPELVARWLNPVAVQHMVGPFHVRRRVSGLSAGSHTFFWRASAEGGACTYQGGPAGSYTPMWIRVSRI